MRRAASTAGPRGSTTGWRRSARKTSRRWRPGTSNTATWISRSSRTFFETGGLRLAGRATGENRFEWPVGKWALKRGGGAVEIAAPAGRRDDDARDALGPARRGTAASNRRPGRSTASLWIGYVPVAGRIEYHMDPEWITLGPSRSRRRRPTSSSRGRRRTASARGFRFTSPASTGRRATACSPAS